ncbi:hypothetical protein BO71DRAFT_435573 [Aspergillus ellipticus CBS 707.79]|uniref:ABM domain-containing protein n=1 Tax=Aspergillus ellipticus CBS 707.79 TaxID=1448320 RepID=A0A319CVX4_9EURO|nr:hypothetical protein BO71DRAFT_435573 [Aspergillus ellipticus CBS 707.79]
MPFTPRSGFTIQVSIFIGPETLEKFLFAFKPIHEKTIAKPQCVFFEAYQAQHYLGHIVLSELVERATRENIKKYAATVGPSMARPREVRFLNRLEGFYAVK